MSKKERKLDRLYAEFDKEYADKSQEDMAKIISDLEKEISGKESAIENLEGEKQENLQKDVEQKKKRLENLKGYSKNKEQIEGIKKYAQTLANKLEQQIIVRDESLELFKEAKKSLIEIRKKLEDEQYTMSLDGDEYNGLLDEKAKIEAEVKKQARTHITARDKVVELEGKISKCNLAWKTLFVNKDWDEIHRIALKDNARFTRKIDSEKNLPLSPEKREKQNIVSFSKELVSKVKEGIDRFQGEDSDRESEDKKSDDKESKAIVESKDGFFKRVWRKIVNWVNGKEDNNKVQEVKKSYSVDLKRNKSKEEKTSNETERDAFLEGLRQHVDVEYKNAVREQKEAQYKEAHKVQPKVEDKDEKEK